ncbi:DUF2391 family protein [Candidatus Woesearchaeota archaeon]|nr:DUF2391 family protein [Candidatus Woesearchaeota archaeon]
MVKKRGVNFRRLNSTRKSKKAQIFANSDIKSELDQVLSLEKKQIKEDKKVQFLEKKQLNKLEELRKLESEIKNKVGEHPLRKITYKDIGKSMIGAFVGIVSHYTILEGLHFAGDISILRANSFYLISFFVGLVMLYYTGFRKVKDVRLFAILPIRLFLIYFVVIISCLIALYFFNVHLDWGLVYKQVAVLSLPAMIGACAADLIGGE